tara:strand:+ start:7104 stop:7907 length:804 start_codon:yes stop_codon:yes gene_type:complete
MKNSRQKQVLKNQIAIITGSSGILGQRFCKLLSVNGAKVIAVDKIKVKNDTFENHENISFVKCDITSEKSVKNLVSDIIRKFGRIDILVNNAATKTNKLKNFFYPFEKYEYSTWKDVMSVNLDAAFLLSKYVGNEMQKKRIAGKIIYISSIYGILGPDHRIYQKGKFQNIKMGTPAVYSASKSALIGLTKYLATYYGHIGIRVNSITPGGIEGEQNSIFKKNYSKRVPLGRMGKEHEIEGALLFLVSDESSYITGQNLIVDGGLSSW